MNLYLVLALALSAISGVVEAPSAARPVLSTLAAQRDRRDHRQAIRVPLRSAGVPQTLLSAGIDRSVCATQPTVTGAAAPRAPAFG
jgi:hypothetical protein